jgi:hypothetical protein
MPLATLVVVIAQALPAVGVLSGLVSTFSQGATCELRGFTAGLAACLVGQGVVVAAMFSIAQSPFTESLALGLLLRALAESMYAFLGLAILFVCCAGVWRSSDRAPVVMPAHA